MKKLVYALIVVFIVACRHEKKDTSTSPTPIDTLAYTYKTLSYKSKYVTKNADTTIAKITYPLFKQTALNEYLKRQVFDFFSPEEKATSYQDIAKSFINGYEDFIRQNSDSEQAWYLNINLKVLKQSKNYIAVQYLHNDYTGGAHGNSYLSYLNYNFKTKQAISLDSLFDQKNKLKLTSIAETIFRKNEHLSPNQALTDQYFFEDGKFALAQNFYIGNKGLVFTYNPYEIKPYVNGTTELIVPFSAIKGLSKPNSILSTL